MQAVAVTSATGALLQLGNPSSRLHCSEGQTRPSPRRVPASDLPTRMWGTVCSYHLLVRNSSRSVSKPPLARTTLYNAEIRCIEVRGRVLDY